MDKEQEIIEKIKKMSELSAKVIEMNRNELLVHLRFMDMALSMLKGLPTPETNLGSDGKYLYYNPETLLKRFREDKKASVRDYLHIIMHCIFRHNYMHAIRDEKLWDLACDIAVESVICELELPCTEVNRELLMQDVFRKLKDDGIKLTAEKLYGYFAGGGISEKKIRELRGIFYADDHKVWYMTEPEKERLFGKAKRDDTDNKVNGGEDGDDGSGGDDDSMTIMESGTTLSLSESEWKDISEHIAMDIENFSKSQGDRAGRMIQNLKEVNREKYDYTAFLRKFAVMNEAMKINDDEFDYIFYTYGLKLYDKMPLVEPLEYKDVKQIKEFVIAIDTSGSTSGKLVQAFLQKTYNILKSEESFSTKINVHIIQCDTEIQEDKTICRIEELDDYVKTMKIRGLGGTDFRPVFAYVAELIRKGEFQNLRGLIYFTDGWGTFPMQKPDYETAFVFIRGEMNNTAVPPWAIKLELDKEDI